MRCIGFPPYYNNDSKTLVLGSFPSVKSREEGFYYSNKQNRFWKMLATCFNAPVPLTVEDKKALLKNNRIALWDIVTECDIVGSMDKDIKNYTVANLSEVLNYCPISKIICNGKKAYEIFSQNYPTLSAVCLPSTSPANGRFKNELWLNELK